MMGMSKDEFRRAVGMWGLAMCLLASAAGWVFIRFGQAWSIADLPISDYVDQIVPAYVFAEVAMIPVGGKIVDKYGCKSVLTFAPSLFIIASMLCMITPTVEMLVIFRILQGAGAGLILALAFTSVGKYYDLDKRGKCNELMTAAFAIGSLFSSSAGYFLTETFNWRFGFIALSILMLVGFILAWRFLPEDQGKDCRVDRLDLILTSMTFAIAALYTQMINLVFDAFSLPSLTFAVIIGVLVFLTIFHAHRSHSPFIPIFTSRYEKMLIFLMFMFSLCGLGLIQYFFKLYLTYYEFDIYKATGMFLFMLAGGALTSMPGVRFVYRTGSKPWVIAGAAFVTISLMVTHLYADKSVYLMALSLFLFGTGLGCIVTEIICSLQTVVSKEDMGVHTSNLMAVRMVAIMAGNALIGTYIAKVTRGDESSKIIDLSTSSDIVVAVKDYIASSLKFLADSMDSGFLMTAITLAMATAALTAIAQLLTNEDLKKLDEHKAEKEAEKGPEE